MVVGVQRVLKPIIPLFYSFFWLCKDHINDLVCGPLTPTLDGVASLTFTCQFEFGIGIVFFLIQIQIGNVKGVLNIIKLGYRGTCLKVIRCVAIRPDFSRSVYVCGVTVFQKLCTMLMDLTETMNSGI